MRLFGSDKPCRVFPLMPLKINSWVDEVNGGLVWLLTAARELVLGAGPARSSKGPPSVAQAPSELNRLVCWPSEPAVTHTLCRVDCQYILMNTGRCKSTRNKRSPEVLDYCQIMMPGCSHNVRPSNLTHVWLNIPSHLILFECILEAKKGNKSDDCLVI